VTGWLECYGGSYNTEGRDGILWSSVERQRRRQAAK